MFGSRLVCVYRTTFGIDMIMHLRSVDLYLWFCWLEMKCLGEFALLSPVGVTYQQYLQTLNSEWRRSQQQSRIHSCL